MWCAGTHAVQAVDPLRITVGVQCLGFTGHQVSSILDEQYNVVAELATQQVSRCKGGPLHLAIAAW